MRAFRLLASIPAIALWLSATAWAQQAVPQDFPVAKGEADLYALGVRIAIVLQHFDDPATFEPKYSVPFNSYGRTGITYYYQNYRFTCKINLGYNSILPALIGYTIENAECCPLSYPFICQTWKKPYNQVGPPDRWAGW
ncbi:MAG TPA: hypothetical protein VFL55_25785 [Acetobacteraceae bacterium]|nr:hypothetical protein [Acetobacteraceae bacterium]